MASRNDPSAGNKSKMVGLGVVLVVLLGIVGWRYLSNEPSGSVDSGVGAVSNEPRASSPQPGNESSGADVNASADEGEEDADRLEGNGEVSANDQNSGAEENNKENKRKVRRPSRPKEPDTPEETPEEEEQKPRRAF